MMSHPYRCVGMMMSCVCVGGWVKSYRIVNMSRCTEQYPLLAVVKWDPQSRQKADSGTEVLFDSHRGFHKQQNVEYRSGGCHRMHPEGLSSNCSQAVTISAQGALADTSSYHCRCV